MVTVVSPHLTAVGATWDEGPEAGRWIAERLGPFGPSLGHAVPLGYAAHAVAPIPFDGDAEDVAHVGPLAILDILLDLLGPFTGDQPVHSGMWDGWGSFFWDAVGPDPGVERPDAEPLELPHRQYHLWTGPLRSATAFRHEPFVQPSLIWPEDRAWFVGVPIYTNEITVAGPRAVIDAILGDPRLDARRATPADVLDGDD